VTEQQDDDTLLDTLRHAGEMSDGQLRKTFREIVPVDVNEDWVIDYIRSIEIDLLAMAKRELVRRASIKRLRTPKVDHNLKMK
jgi:hypothetical protein